MRIWRLSLIALALVATAGCNDKGGKDAPPAKPSPPTTELVSLAWTPANANQNLQSFEFELTGADVISVCRKPPGWIIESTGSTIKGYATVGAGFISVDELADLDSLFLIRHHAGKAFGVGGKLLTGVYADNGGQTEIKATLSLLSGKPAEQCPPKTE